MNGTPLRSIFSEHLANLPDNAVDRKKVQKLFQERSWSVQMVQRLFQLNCENSHQEWLPKKILRHVVSCKQPEAVRLTRLFIDCFDDLEQTPVKVDEPIKDKYIAWLETSVKVAEWAKDTQCEVLQDLGVQIQAKRLGMLYRLGIKNGGLDKLKGCERVLYEGLVKQANDWILKQSNLEYNYLTPAAKLKIEEVCKYRDFADLLNRNNKFRERFFKWIIRDKNDVDTFVQFLGTMDWMGSIVTKRFRGSSKVEEIDGERVLTLPFAGIRHSVLNREKKIVLENNYALKVKEMVNIIRGKNDQEGNVNFYAARGCGFINWHIQKLGRYNPETKKYDTINIRQNGWWQKLPVVDEYSPEEFAKKFNLNADFDNDIQEENVYKIVFSSRTRESLDFDGAHGWYGVAYPDQEKRTYVVMHVGKFPDYFPKSVSDTLRFIANTYKAVIALHDDNASYTQRQTTWVSRRSKEKLPQTMKNLADKIEQAGKGGMAFQIGGKGCAKFAQSRFNQGEKEEIDLFKTPVKNIQPNNLLLKFLNKIIAAVPEKYTVKVFQLIISVFGPHRVIEFKKNEKQKSCSLKLTNLWKDAELHHPPSLHDKQIQQIKEYARGEITWKDAKLLRHLDENSLREGKFPIVFLQRAYNESLI